MDIYNLERFLLSIVYPNRCAVCGEVIHYKLYFCVQCAAQLKENVFEGAEACYEYDGAIRNLVLDAKYSANGYAVAMMAKFMYDKIIVGGMSKPDVITFITSRKSAVRARGYCLSRMLARDISRLSGIPLAQLLNVKDYETSQKELSVEQRAQNLKGVFSLVNKVDITDKKVLIIDDISTTGATLKEASKLFTENGATTECFVFAKTMKKSG
ncbi:MAG: double zinc ribbon domain-containing protein [Oscillospiraceae bacterium]|nr:double zinc ribbon domain-containing protein [Oscillospiraceae bacterium]